MTSRRARFVLAAALALGAAPLLLGGAAGFEPGRVTTSGGSGAARADKVSFAESILPFFQDKCVRCHGGMDEGELRVEAGLDLTSWVTLMAGSEFGDVIAAGDPDGSILVDMVALGDMPGEGESATPEELEALRAWVAEGALNN